MARPACTLPKEQCAHTTEGVRRPGIQLKTCKSYAQYVASSLPEPSPYVPTGRRRTPARTLDHHHYHDHDHNHYPTTAPLHTSTLAPPPTHPPTNHHPYRPYHPTPTDVFRLAPSRLRPATHHFTPHLTHPPTSPSSTGAVGEKNGGPGWDEVMWWCGERGGWSGWPRRSHGKVEVDGAGA